MDNLLPKMKFSVSRLSMLRIDDSQQIWYMIGCLSESGGDTTKAFSEKSGVLWKKKKNPSIWTRALSTLSLMLVWVGRSYYIYYLLEKYLQSSLGIELQIDTFDHVKLRLPS